MSYIDELKKLGVDLYEHNVILNATKKDGKSFNRNQKLVLFYMLTYSKLTCTSDARKFTITYKTLADRVKVSSAAINNTINHLEQAGLIKIHNRNERGLVGYKKLPNVYEVLFAKYT